MTDLHAQRAAWHDSGAVEPRLTRHPDGITAIDTEYVRPGLDAAHLIVWQGRAAFVDTGTAHSVPLLLAALDRLGISRDAVDYVLLTHVHLDHAGGAGPLMQALPNAKAVLHPRGAPHMIEPEKLIAGSIAVYGEEAYTRLYGTVVPIPAERVVVTEDGHRLELGGREIGVIHTPGHALHHQAFIDKAGGSVFTGDTFGLSYREFDTHRGPFILPTTTPSQFDPAQLIASIRRIASHDPYSAYLTHYSRVTGVAQLAQQLEQQIDEFVDIARTHAAADDRAQLIRNDMRALWLQRARQHGCTMTEDRFDDLLRGDLDLNTQGLIAWLDRSRKA